MASPGDRNDPYGQFNFLVELDGLEVAGFAEVGGITSETDVIAYREGTAKGGVRKLPGLTHVGNIVLKRGFTASTELWEWRKTVVDGRTERKSGAIIVLDEARQPVLRFVFREGWPCKWAGPLLNAQGCGVAIETLEIASEHVELEA